MPTLEEDILDLQAPDADASAAEIRTINSGSFIHSQLHCYCNCREVSWNCRSKSVGDQKLGKWVVELGEISGPLWPDKTVGSVCCLNGRRILRLLTTCFANRTNSAIRFTRWMNSPEALVTSVYRTSWIYKVHVAEQILNYFWITDVYINDCDIYRVHSHLFRNFITLEASLLVTKIL
jgi:hypothetical protein